MDQIVKLCYLLVLMLTACSPVDENLLIGKWTGIAVTEEGTPINVNPSEIKMTFGEKGYAYFSTLNYREAGSYYIHSKYLFTTDTLNQASTEKAVEIVKLTPDSLVLKMEEAGKERFLMMEKTE
ncbi:MAG: lipocalin family protein [Phaeodactylibacter sp.]|nr:lipocalin family protein [Phaeodactylibacter sp.]MCB9288363.1 lipocalin family protein [Lewinellaceae bacterium]